MEIFSSYTGTQISSSYEAGRHGLFTYYLLKGMREAADQNNDGKITLAELETYVKAKVSSQATRMGTECIQEPMVIGRKDRPLIRLK